MARPGKPDNLAEVLANQSEIMAVLADEPATQLEIGNRIGVSHSTAHRRTKVLEEQGLVEQRGQQYELTEFGWALLDRHDQYLDVLDDLCHRRAVQQELGGAVSLDAPILDGAEIFFGDSYAIDVAGYKNRRLFENAVRSHGVLDGTMAQYFTVFENNDVIEKSVVIIPDEQVETILEAYRDPIWELFQQDFYELYQTPKPVPYTSTVVETHDRSVAILNKHTGGQLQFNLQNGDPAAIEWVNERYERFLADAEPVEPQMIRE